MKSSRITRSQERGKKNQQAENNDFMAAILYSSTMVDIYRFTFVKAIECTIPE